MSSYNKRKKVHRKLDLNDCNFKDALSNYKQHQIQANLLYVLICLEELQQGFKQGLKQKECWCEICLVT